MGQGHSKGLAVCSRWLEQSPALTPLTNLCDLEAAKLLSLHVVSFGTGFWRICSLVASGVAMWARED